MGRGERNTDQCFPPLDSAGSTPLRSPSPALRPHVSSAGVAVPSQFARGFHAKRTDSEIIVPGLRRRELFTVYPTSTLSYMFRFVTTSRWYNDFAALVLLYFNNLFYRTVITFIVILSESFLSNPILDTSIHPFFINAVKFVKIPCCTWFWFHKDSIYSHSVLSLHSINVSHPTSSDFACPSVTYIITALYFFGIPNPVLHPVSIISESSCVSLLLCNTPLLPTSCHFPTATPFFPFLLSPSLSVSPRFRQPQLLYRNPSGPPSPPPSASKLLLQVLCLPFWVFLPRPGNPPPPKPRIPRPPPPPRSRRRRCPTLLSRSKGRNIGSGRDARGGRGGPRGPGNKLWGRKRTCLFALASVRLQDALTLPPRLSIVLDSKIR